MFATAADGVDDLDDLVDSGALAAPTAWLFGNEAHGVSADLRGRADRVVRLPVYGRAESLNLAAAAAICLYASARAQRRSRPRDITQAWARVTRLAGSTCGGLARAAGSAYDDLPDAVVVADASGVVVEVNAAARAPARRGPARACSALTWRRALPLVDPQGRDWWECTKPFSGMSTRVRQPERLLTLSEPGRDDRDLFVTAVLRPRRRPPARAGRGLPARHGRPQPLRAKWHRAAVGRRPRAALAVDQREGLHRDPAGEVGPLHRRAEAAHASHDRRRCRPADPPDQ